MAVKCGTERNHEGCGHKTERNAEQHSVPRVFARLAGPSGPKGACDGGDNAATERALRDGNDQRNQRKDRRDDSQGIDARL